MIKTLTKHGNSYALVIDKAIMELLNIKPDSPLLLSTEDGKSLLVRPVETARQQKFQDAMEDTLATYDKAFEELAK
ncbi:MAG: AbrB/MazE/SpoVT family DNA-binding domain-containing protein [Phycisphaerae bacterium]|nr:AbrB/MazE/SpoVT family DNA-binding domain-containing protein [Phycisphaerae bacterium]MBI9019283.1 AbrB/MazE/SpoVT family DNA-binding domain-containing protein [Phycisphaerae bacterium]